MRVVVQRVSQASVSIHNQIKATIGYGLMILVGFEEADNDQDIEWMSKKISNLRIFDDENGIMNRSILEVNGELLIVSQFTLHAMTAKGNRPSYIRAARPETAIPLYERFLSVMETKTGKEVGSGTFGADMQVALINDGPVTILIDSKQKE